MKSFRVLKILMFVFCMYYDARVVVVVLFGL